MQIEFPNSEPQYSAGNLTLTFIAKVDGHAVRCAVTVEALEDHFGAHGATMADWLQAFAAARAAIESVARRHLVVSGGKPVLLKSGHFPPEPVDPVYRSPSIDARPA